MISRIMWSSTLRIARCCSTNVSVAKTQTLAPLSKIAAANAFNTIMYKGRQVCSVVERLNDIFDVDNVGIVHLEKPY